MTTEPTTETIPLNQIDAPLFNSRLPGDSKIEELAASIKAHGLKQPIVVSRLSNGRFRLKAGSRRLRAVQLNGESSIRASVEAETTEADEAIDNALENLQREDLTTFETARTLHHLRKLGFSIKDTTAATGFSKNWISSLVVQFETMPDDLKVLWQGRDPLFTTAFLDEMNRIKDPAEKRAFYAERKELLNRVNAGAGDGDEDDSPKKKPTKNSTSVSVKLATYQAIRKALMTLKGEPVAIQVIDYLVGERKKVPDVLADLLSTPTPTPPTTQPNGKPVKGKKGK